MSSLPDAAALMSDERYGPMIKQVSDQPVLYKLGLVKGAKVTVGDRPVRVFVVFGLGGSAMPGTMLASLASSLAGVPVTVSCGSHPPSWVSRDDLVALVSYSGRTQEVIRALDLMTKRGVKPLVITSGGRLLQYAEELNLNVVRLTPDMTPRMSVPEMFGALAAVYHRVSGCGELSPESISSTAERLATYWRRISPEVRPEENDAKRCAILTSLGTLSVFAWGHLHAAAVRLRNQLAENAKLPCVVHEVPENLHNTVEGLSAFKGLKHVALRSRNEPQDVSTQFSAIGALLDLEHTFTFSGSLVYELMSAVMWADACSLYAAALRNVDPREIPTIGKIRRAVEGE
ncbi:MAG: SIS domain-containing protein [Thaumarchaeota archaeon]|nr:SIS domain-containing protein [Candidatus Calditenuaceae archaeon]MDW8041857.1 SIS domain-containing protein [Nitrososphaerota archaeon]